MAYSITKSAPHDTLVPVPYDSRVVATLDEARSDVIVAVTQSPNALNTTTLHTYVQGITESGGTIGPLPDGTVIEVRPTDRPATIARDD